jgi:hypothetical protein
MIPFVVVCRFRAPLLGCYVLLKVPIRGFKSSLRISRYVPGFQLKWGFVIKKKSSEMVGRFPPKYFMNYLKCVGESGLVAAETAASTLIYF